LVFCLNHKNILENKSFAKQGMADLK